MEISPEKIMEEDIKKLQGGEEILNSSQILNGWRDLFEKIGFLPME